MLSEDFKQEKPPGRNEPGGVSKSKYFLLEIQYYIIENNDKMQLLNRLVAEINHKTDLFAFLNSSLEVLQVMGLRFLELNHPKLHSLTLL